MQRDATKQKEAEAELLAAKQAAEEAGRAKDHFLATLSHELRTPLTPVMMTTAELLADPGLGPELREAVEMIHRNVDLETRLIDDLLDLMRQIRLTCPQVRGIALSGHGMESDLEQSRSAGFSAHLVKPVDPARLDRTICDILSPSA